MWGGYFAEITVRAIFFVLMCVSTPFPVDRFPRKPRVRYLSVLNSNLIMRLNHKR